MYLFSTWLEWPAFSLIFILLLLFNHQVVSDTFATPWTIDHQAPLSMGFPRQEYWSGLPFPSPGDLPDPGIETTSPALTGGLNEPWSLNRLQKYHV